MGLIGFDVEREGSIDRAGSARTALINRVKLVANDNATPLMALAA